MSENGPIPTEFLIPVNEAMTVLPNPSITEATLRRKVGKELTEYRIGSRLMLDRREVEALIQRVD